MSVRDHYDAVQTTSKRDRARGDLFLLKKFHNHVKRSLLETYAAGADRLLDLACGRGGDLQKWHDCRVQFVKGVDMSSNEIQEARARYAAMKTSMVCSFEVVDLLDGTFRQAPCYDVVTAMFCIHYFCESTETLARFVDLVAKSLRPGGYFLGCCLDGSLVHDMHSEHVDIKRLEGRRILFALRDTVTSATSASQGSVEYLVDLEELTSVARDAGLERLRIDPFDPPHEYPGDDVSRLFCSFVFRKV
jgi:mRNA (guanine-N7-)-methyltransferase